MLTPADQLIVHALRRLKAARRAIAACQRRNELPGAALLLERVHALRALGAAHGHRDHPQWTFCPLTATPERVH
jgi:hypothetical protein